MKPIEYWKETLERKNELEDRLWIIARRHVKANGDNMDELTGYSFKDDKVIISWKLHDRDGVADLGAVTISMEDFLADDFQERADAHFNKRQEELRLEKEQRVKDEAIQRVALLRAQLKSAEKRVEEYGE